MKILHATHIQLPKSHTHLHTIYIFQTNIFQNNFLLRTKDK